MPDYFAVTDPYAPIELWTPKVGDRVRIDLGECPAEHEPFAKPGHLPGEQWRTGTVTSVDLDDEPGAKTRHDYPEYAAHHHIRVEWDVPIPADTVARFGGTSVWVYNIYAVCELTPLDPQVDPQEPERYGFGPVRRFLDSKAHNPE